MTDAPPLFGRLLGGAYDCLDPRVRAVHDRPGEWLGQCRVERGRGFFSGLAGRLMGLPPAGVHEAIRVRIDADGGVETWTRFIGGARMRSRLRDAGGMLAETMGPATFRFALEPGPGGIRWRLRSVSSLGVPLPLALFGVEAREWAEDGRYRFRVSAKVAGRLLVAYDGALEA